MHRFQAHGDLQRAAQQIPEPRNLFPDQPRMRLNDHTVGKGEPSCNGGIIRDRDGSGIEETTTVIELNLLQVLRCMILWPSPPTFPTLRAAGRERGAGVGGEGDVFEGEINLSWNRAGGHRIG